MAIEPLDLTKRLDLKDDQMFRLGDVIDVKASIALIVITFLATQTADFLKDPHSTPTLHYMQLASAICLAVGGALAMLELWPRDYEVEHTEGFEDWARELRGHFKDDPNAEQKVFEELQYGQNRRTVQRIATNSALNYWKSQYLIWSFRSTVLALALNLITLIVRAAS